MTDQLKDAAAQVILAALHTAEQTGEWIKGQIPDVLSQLIRYNIVMDAVWIAVSVSLLVVGVWASVRYRKPIIKHTDGMAYMLWTFAIGPIIGLSVCVPDLLKILIAPKVWILEYARHLL